MTQIWAQNFFSWILPLLVVRHCYKISLYVIARKTNEPNLRKWQKPSFESKFGPHNFFSWILAILHVTHGCKLSLYANSRKTKEPDLKKWYSFGTDSGPFGPNLDPKFFFINVTSAMLGIVAGYHCMQFQEKLIKTKLEKMAKNLVPRPILAPLAQICPPKKFSHRFYLYYTLYIIASCHCMQFQGKLMNQTGENSKKPSFGPNFGPFGPNLGHQFFLIFFS